MEEIYLAGGCLWGVQEYLRHIPGVNSTEAGRANGTTHINSGDYDGYAECVRVFFDTKKISLEKLIDYFFEIIDPYSLDKQGPYAGRKYRTGIYSRNEEHLLKANSLINKRDDSSKILVEVLFLDNYVRSSDEHQDRLTRIPSEECHLPRELLHKHMKTK